jgi:hypothetical protein
MYVCEKCGCNEIEVRYYVNANTLEIANKCSSSRSCFCPDCRSTSKFVETTMGEPKVIVKERRRLNI